MSLKARLDTLRGQAGGVVEEAPPTESGALAAKLDRLGARRGRRARPSGQQGKPEAIAARLGGRLVAETVVLVETVLPLSHSHGCWALRDALGPQHLPDWSDGPLVFVDTETSGLSGGAGTVAFLIGLGHFEADALRLRQYFLTSFAGEATMLKAVAAELVNARALVSYNGKSFDIPLLRDRFRLAGLPAPFEALGHRDLLHPTRRLFDRSWPDCRLATAERRLLGFQRQDDLPGAEAPLVWFDLVHHGAMTRLPAVARHNLLDLVSMAALLPALAAAHECPQDWTADPMGVARAWRRAGDEAEARRVLATCARHLDGPGLLELARLHRRAGAWREAVAIWEGLAATGKTDAVEHLAKYHEHVCRDWSRALALVERLPFGEDTARRRQRLSSKLQGVAPNGQLDLP